MTNANANTRYAVLVIGKEKRYIASYNKTEADARACAADIAAWGGTVIVVRHSPKNA